MFKTDKLINKKLSRLYKKGGKVTLKSTTYTINSPIKIDTPSSSLEGEVWAYNLDPNGVFETPYGTKLRLNGKDHPAINIGGQSLPAGCVLKNFGIQGDIVGMDTRGFFDITNPKASAGLYFENNRVDQGLFKKISCCGLASAVCVTDNAEIDACKFTEINADGCCLGVYFAPGASYYAKFESCIIADNPSYGFFADSCNIKPNSGLHNLFINKTTFVRNCGASKIANEPPCAVYLKNISASEFSNNLVDAPGTYWHYDANATSNDERQINENKAVGLIVIGNKNRLLNNTFINSSCESVIINGNENVFAFNLVDSDVIIDGENNVVNGLVFTKDTAKLILKGKAVDTTTIIGVEENRIVKLV
jgi:hypothetical protein